MCLACEQVFFNLGRERLGKPLKRRRLMTSEAHTSARAARNPRLAAWAKPFGIHGRMRAVGAPHAGSPAIGIEIA